MKHVLHQFATHFHTIHRVPLIRYIYSRIRLLGFSAFRRVRSLHSHGSVPDTVHHNLKSLRSFNVRNEKLLLTSHCIEDLCNLKTLLVGCRTEEEIFLFRGHGFRDVTAIDLSSYSPLITLADMHSMPYPDNHFDFVFCAYTLSYSSQPRKAAREFLRVLRDGGFVAIAVEYSPWEQRTQVQEALLGYTIVPDERLETVHDILSLFEPHVRKVFVQYDAERKRHHTVHGTVGHPSPVIAVFSASKQENSVISPENAS